MYILKQFEFIFNIHDKIQQIKMLKSYSFHIVSVILLVFCVSCQFDTSRFRIVDQNQNHVLVRGNLPILNNTFQFQTLYQALSGFTGTKGYRLVIYSLLNLLTAKQTKSRYIQQNHFNRDGQYRYENTAHYYYNHDIIGSYFSPAQYPSFLKKYAIKYYNFITYDKIPHLLQRIERNMKSPIPTIVYVHCSQGVDRAGYVAGAYKMKNFAKSFRQVIEQNLQVMKSVRSYIHFNSFNGMQWYCLSLKRSDQQCLVGVQGARKGNFGDQEVQSGKKKKTQPENKEKTKQK